MMNLKKLAAAAAAVCMLAVPAVAETVTETEVGFAETEVESAQNGYTEKMTTVFSEGENAGELALRFYEEAPNVPYIGMKEYCQFMKNQPLTLHENEDGTFALENEAGAQLLCDPESGVITTPDWVAFAYPPTPVEGDAAGWKDSNCAFVRVTNVDFEGEAKETVFDFSKYGIKVYADSEDIYLPVFIMSNIMTDIATAHMLYNGENLYSQRVDIEMAPVEGFYLSDMYQNLLTGGDRPEDVIRYSYGGLCFNFDHFFGHPGVARLDEALLEKGLDAAITDLGEDGRTIKEGLFSPRLADYLKAMMRLFMVYLGDGHTVFTSAGTMASNPAALGDGAAIVGELTPAYTSSLLESNVDLEMTLNESIKLQRTLKWGSKDYIESGSTAIIRLDGFMPDEEGWKNYYENGGDVPSDCLGIVAAGLKKASENPEIKNVIFDLSCNGGGSSDVLMAILAMTTGQDQLYGINKLTGQKMTVTFEADTDFNGVFDEKDKENRYDFNYGVLTTRHAFSCGNLFPIITREGGAVVIGEPTSGGSCCIQIGSDPLGLSYVMSSAHWQLIDSQGVSVEGGSPVDMPIEPKENSIVNLLSNLAGVDADLPSFSAYFDEAALDEMMNSWFAGEEETEIAA